MAFRPKPDYLSVAELQNLTRICPSAESFRLGFTLGEAECDELVQAAQKLEASQVFVDPLCPAPMMADLLARTVRLLQVSLDQQFQENQQVVDKLNEYTNREFRMRAEIERLRVQQNRPPAVAGAEGLQAKCDDLAQRLEEEYRSNDGMRAQCAQDELRIRELEARLQQIDALLLDRDAKLKAADSEYMQLNEAFSDLRANFDMVRMEAQAAGAKQQLGDTMRQQAWKSERMMKDNSALARQNVELRQQLADVKAENIEVSERIVLLDDEVRKQRAHVADTDARAEQLAADKTALLSTNDALRMEVNDKMVLLEEFEARFQRQFKSWEEDRATLQAQIHSLHAAAASKNRESRSTDDWSGVDQEELLQLRDELSMAREKEILLLEAYEQLEKDVGKEIDLALSKQGEDLKATQRRADFLQQRMDQEREATAGMRRHLAHLEDLLKDAQLRNQQYESGMYGMPQAVEEIHALKEAVYKEQGRVREMVQQMSTMSGKIEDLHDENTVLRKRAGMEAHDTVNLQDVRLQKQASIAQLRSLNALLERQVADLEEERRKLRMELKFRAKYHGQHALEMGLSPDQLLLVEQFVDDIKHGKNDEARIVDQMQHRIEFLEVRLAEVMAYADIPPAMRPALSEYDPFAVAMGQSRLPTGTQAAYPVPSAPQSTQMGAQAGTQAAVSSTSTGDTTRAAAAGAAAGTTSMRAAQLQSVKEQLLTSLNGLRATIERAGAEGTPPDILCAMDALSSQLTDCFQAVDAVLLDMRKDAQHQTQEQQHAQTQQTQTSGPRAPAQPATRFRFMQRPDGQRVPVPIFDEPRVPGGPTPAGAGARGAAAGKGAGGGAGISGSGFGASGTPGYPDSVTYGSSEGMGLGSLRFDEPQRADAPMSFEEPEASTVGARVGGQQGDFLADAIADELRAKLREMAKQMAELQATVIQKDAVLQQIAEQKGGIETQLGVPVKDRQPASVPRQDYESLGLECASLKEQLVQCLEELGARERECQELGDAGSRHQVKLQTFSDQLKMLYREYANALSIWRAEKSSMERRIKRLQEDADGHKAAASEFARGLDTFTRNPGAPAVHKELGDTVRRMAVVQIKHAKLARELEASVMGEKALNERVEALEQEVRDVSSTCRARMRWLEQAADGSKRRVEALFRELQMSAPLSAYHLLVSKHARQQAELRRLLEESSDHVVGGDEVYQLREDLAGAVKKYDEVCDANTELKEKMRIAALVSADKEAGPRPVPQPTFATKTEAPGEAHAHAHITGIGASTSGAALSAAAGGVGGLGSSPPTGGLDSRLTQELVEARVATNAANRRAEMLEADRDRVRRSLDEAQAQLREVDARLAQASGELELARTARASLEQRLMGAKTRAEVDELMRRLDAAEQIATQKFNDHANLSYRAEEAERKLEQAGRDRQRHLAELTNLRAALRDAMGRSEHAVTVGKLHEQLDHALAKEALARNALNRSELARIDVEKELRGLKSELITSTARVVAHQDQARWADKQRQEAQSQLDLSIAGRTEAWKSKLWSRKLQQLKARNDSLADGLELARRRINKQEEARDVAEQKLEYAEDVGALLRKGVSEVVRDAARLHDQLFQMRIERGRMQREEVLMREKINFVERVNAELHELIEKYEAEFFQQQMDLEAEKANALSQARTLQDEVMQLQERLASTMATLASAAGSAERAGPGGARGGAGLQAQAGRDTRPRAVDQDTRRQPYKRFATLDPRVSVDTGNRLKDHLATAAMGDRNVMLRQIEAHKTARQEAEIMKQEVCNLQDQLRLQGDELSDVRRHHNDALARVKEQSEALLSALSQQKARGEADEDAVAQVKAIAEAVVAELKARLKERDAALEALEANMAQDKARWFEQHKKDRAEIEGLNQRLFERNNASIGNMKELLSRVPRSGPDASTAGHQLQHMKDALARTNEDMSVLRNQLEQKDAALDLMQRSFEAQAQKQAEELATLRAQLGGNAKDENSARAALAKLQHAARTKDDKLRQLRDAFRTLEGKLVEAHMRIADNTMEQAGKETDVMDQLKKAKAANARLEREKGELASQLSLAQEQAAKPAPGSAGDAAMVRMREQLQGAQKRSEGLEEDLNRSRAALQKLKNAERSVVDLTSGMSIEAKRQIEELQRRLHVLEKQNAALSTKARNLQDHSTSTSFDQGPPGTGPSDGGGGGGGSSRPPSTRGTHRPSSGAGRGTSTRSAGSSGAQPTTSGGFASSGAFFWGVGPGEGGQPQQQQQREMPGAATAPEPPGEAAAKTAAAVAAWDERKQLAKRVEDLRRKLAAKQEEALTARTDSDKKAAQVTTLQGELDKQAQAFRDLQEKLRKAQAAPKLTTDTSKLREYVDRVERAEAECDSLRQQLARARSQAAAAAAQPVLPPPPHQRPSTSAAGSSEETLKKDMELHELRLQRDQAQVQVKRLKDRLSELFGPEAGTSKGGAKGGPSIGGAREAELMATIGNLKTALEKATSSTTPTTKFMAEVSRRKEAVRELEAAKAEIANLRGAAGAAARLMAEMQAANAELRTQLSRAVEGVAAKGGAGAAVSEAATAQATNLEMLLGQRDAELQRMRLALEEREQQLASALAAARPSADTAALRAALEEVESENADLKAELNAFDPKFFEEIEDLKHDHYVLKTTVDDYERVIQQLSAQLGSPPPIPLRR